MCGVENRLPHPSIQVFVCRQVIIRGLQALGHDRPKRLIFQEFHGDTHRLPKPLDIAIELQVTVVERRLDIRVIGREFHLTCAVRELQDAIEPYAFGVKGIGPSDG